MVPSARFAAVGLVLGLAACGDGSSTSAPDADAGSDAGPVEAGPDADVDAGADAAPPALDLGVAYSPRGYASGTTPQDRTDFLSGHAAYGRVVAYHVNWRDAQASAGAIPATATSAQADAKTYGGAAFVGFGWDHSTATGDDLDLASPGDPTNDWTNAASRAAFVRMVTDYAKTYQPPYVFLGNEVNTYQLAHPSDWPSFVSELGACHDAIKAVSPSTLVLVTFQYERLVGGGKKNGWSTPAQWDLVADLAGKIDAIGFTSYPFFDFDTPAAIPGDYYAPIASHFTGPVLFTEIGWKAAPSAPYAGSEADQAAFVGVFFDRVAALRLRYAAWLFEHDVDAITTGPFAAIGLRTNAGAARPSDAAWRAAVLAHQTP